MFRNVMRNLLCAIHALMKNLATACICLHVCILSIHFSINRWEPLQIRQQSNPLHMPLSYPTQMLSVHRTAADYKTISVILLF